MLTMSEIRRRNTIRLVDSELGGKRVRLAKLIGRSTGYVSRMLKEDASGARHIGNKMARDIEAALGKDEGWLDQNHNVVTATLEDSAQFGEPSVAQAQRPNPPVDYSRFGRYGPVRVACRAYLIPEDVGGFFVREVLPPGLSFGASWDDDQELGFLPIAAPSSSAFALLIEGRALFPRFSSGDFAIINPEAQALPGDEVYVSFRDGREALMRLGWRRDDSVQLRVRYGSYFTRPEKRQPIEPLVVPVEQIAQISRVIGIMLPGSMET